jgi:hypothetical protein
VDKLTMSLDETEAVFVRKPKAPDEPTLRSLAGTYQAPDGAKFKVVYWEGSLCLVAAAEPPITLTPYKRLTFHQREFSDHEYKFILDNGRVSGLHVSDPSGEVPNKRTD